MASQGASGYHLHTDRYNMGRFGVSNQSTTSSQLSQGPSVEEPIYGTRDGSVITTDELSPNEREKYLKTQKGGNFSRQSTPDSVDDFEVIMEQNEIDKFASWITGDSSKNTSIDSSTNLQSGGPSTAEVLALADRMRAQLQTTEPAAAKQKDILLQITQQKPEQQSNANFVDLGAEMQPPIPIPAARSKNVRVVNAAVTDFGGQTCEDSFIKHNLNEVEMKNKEIQKLQEKLEIQVAMMRDTGTPHLEELRAFQNENKELKKALTDNEQQYQNLIRSQENQKKKVEQENSHLKSKLQSVEANFERLKLEYENLQRNESSNKDQSQKLLDQLLEENKILQQEVESSRQNGGLLEKQVDDLNLQLALRNDELKSLKNGSEKCRQELEQRTAEIVEVNTEMRDAKQKLKESETELKNQRKHVKDLEQTQGNLRSIIETMQKQQEDRTSDLRLETELKRCKVQLEAREREIAELKLSFNEALPKLDQLAKQNPPYEDVLLYLKRATEAIKEKDEQLQKYGEYIQKMQDHLRSLNGNGAASAENASLRMENEAVKNELVDVKQKAETVYQSLLEKEKLSENFRALVTQKEKEIADCKKSVRDLNDEKDVLKAQVAVREEDFKDERDRANRIKDEYDQEKVKWSEKEADLRAEITKLGRLKQEDDHWALQRNNRPQNNNANKSVNGYGNSGRQGARPVSRERSGNARDFQRDRSGGGSYRDRNQGRDRSLGRDRSVSRSSNNGRNYSIESQDPRIYGSQNQLRRGDLSNSGSYGTLQDHFYESLDDNYMNRSTVLEQSGASARGAVGGQPTPANRNSRGGASGFLEQAYGMFVGGGGGKKTEQRQQPNQKRQERFPCPLCVEERVEFPDCDGLQVHLNEDHPDLN